MMLTHGEYVIMFYHGSILNGHVLPILDMIRTCQNMFKHVNEHADTFLN